MLGSKRPRTALSTIWRTDEGLALLRAGGCPPRGPTRARVRVGRGEDPGTELLHLRYRRQDLPQRPPKPHTATDHRPRSEEHTSELQSRGHLVCRLLLEKKKKRNQKTQIK